MYVSQHVSQVWGKLHPVYEDNCRMARVIIALGSSVVVYAESVLRLFDEESQ